MTGDASSHRAEAHSKSRIAVVLRRAFFVSGIAIAIAAWRSWPLGLGSREARLTFFALSLSAIGMSAVLRLGAIARWISRHRKLVSVGVTWAAILFVGIFSSEIYARSSRGYLVWQNPLKSFSQLEKLRVYNRLFYHEHLDYFRGFPIRIPLFDAATHAPHYLFKKKLSVASRSGMLVPARAGEPVYWSSDSWGFHSPEFSVRKRPGVLRIVCLGASTTEGQGPETDSYPRILERVLRNRYGRRIEVINAGHSGYNAEDIVALFKRRIRPLHPDIALFYEAANNIQVPNFIARQTPHGILRRVHDFFYRNSAIFVMLSDQFGWRKTTPSRRNYRLDLSSKPGKASPDAFEEHLEELARTVRESGAELVMSSFVTLAHEGLRIRYEDNRSQFNDLYNGIYVPLVPGDIARVYDHFNDRIRKVAGKYRLQFVDVAKTFPRDPRYFPFDIIHLTPAGNRILANRFADALESEVFPRLNGGLGLPGGARGR
jgi:lysophospholipase L1-like esterase